MKRIKKIQAGGFYIFRGEVAANSNFIETVSEAKQFLKYANFFLKEYLIVYDYNITRHEWHMVVKLKSGESRLTSSGKESGSPEFSQPLWRIVSERMRLFLSRYVVTVNKMRGRTGTLVHSSYERYFFETLGEAKSVIEGIRQQTFRMFRRKPKYRGLKHHYLIPKKLGKGSIFLCSRDVKLVKNRGGSILKNQHLSDLQDLVLQKLIDSTKKIQNFSKNSIFHPKIE